MSPTKVGSIFVELGADNSKLVKGIQESLGKMKDLAGQFQSLTGLSNGAALAITGVGMGLVAAGKYVGDAMKDTQAYNLSMSEMAENLMITTEEASKLSAAAQRVGISQNVLEAALKAALKNGVVPSIAGLGTLADQYVAIKDPAEKGAFLLKEFGKNGLEMGQMMQNGAGGVQFMTDAIQGNLVVTRQQGEAAQAAAKNQAMYNQYLKDYKLLVGNQFLPVQQAFLQTTIANAEAALMLKNAGIQASQGLVRYWGNLIMVARESADGVEETGFLKNAIDGVGSTLPDATDLTDALAEATGGLAANAGLAAEGLNKEYKNLLNLSGFDPSSIGGGKKGAIDWAKLGGGTLNKAWETFTSIDMPANADKYQWALNGMDKLNYDFGIANAQMLKESGGDWKTAAQDISKAYGKTMIDVTKDIKGVKMDLGSLGGRADFFVYIWTMYMEQDARYSQHIVPPGMQNQTTINPLNNTSNNTTQQQGATGGSFTVPPGHPTDTFPILAKSGEQVDVTPVGQVGESDAERIVARLDSLPREFARAVRDAILTK